MAVTRLQIVLLIMAGGLLGVLLGACLVFVGLAFALSTGDYEIVEATDSLIR